MRHVRVRVTADGHEAAIHPVYDIWANAEFIRRSRALQWNQTDDALGILHFAEGDADAFEAAITDIPEVRDYDILRAGADAFYVYLRDATTESLQELFGSLVSGTIVIVPPIVYHEDGWVTISLFGPADEVQAAIEHISDPVRVSIEEVSGLGSTAAAAETRLTDRQRAALDAALELGYYDVPRTASHEDVAAALDCAPSTAAEHIRKAEARLVRSVLGSRA